MKITLIKSEKTELNKIKRILKNTPVK